MVPLNLKKPSRSTYIPIIAEKISEIKNVKVDELMKQCLINTLNCYGI
jgi:Tat protein secretion system quality control protein TatD with DNase activity